jgi:alkanesulfonate monooxygenase
MPQSARSEGAATRHPDALEILGMISTNYASESHAPQGAQIDPSYTAAFALAHEQAGFDRVLIGYHSAAPDGFQVAAYVAQRTGRLGILLAHRPGVIQPTVAARQIATLDQFSGGRLAVHIISGGSDAEQRRDGDFLSKDERYARTDDYLNVIKKTWAETTPFDHDGPYYQVRDSFSAVKPVQQPHVPIFFGGASDAAVRVAGRHAETYAFFGETLVQTAEIIGRVRASAAAHGRPAPRFSVSFRPILGHTEDAAWARAERILADAQAIKDAGASIFRRAATQSEGARRLLEAAAGGKVRDKRLWTEIATLTGAPGNTTALVGTPGQVVDALLDYYDLGVRTFLFRGFDPLEDAIGYGRHLLPLLRETVAERGRPALVAAE